MSYVLGTTATCGYFLWGPKISILKLTQFAEFIYLTQLVMDLHLPAEDPPPNLEILSALSSDEDEDQPDEASPLPTLTLGSVFETFPSLKSGTIYKYVLSNYMGIVMDFL